MTGRSLLIVCALGISSIGVASAKSYYFTLSTTTKAGAVELKAGEYQLSLKGTTAVLTNDGGKAVSIPVKVEQNDKKFDNTMVNTSSDHILQEIDLGGSTTKVQFGQ